MINNLRKIVEKSDTKLGLIFDLSIQALIIASIVIFSLETLPDLDPSTIELLGALEVVLVAVFSLDLQWQNAK
jgi:voltage-gated potassium channel